MAQYYALPVTYEQALELLRNNPRQSYVPVTDAQKHELEEFLAWMHKQEPENMRSLDNYRNLNRLIKFAQGWRPKAMKP